MRTRVTELLGISEPILQGGMAWVAEHHLAAAVSEAGGLGILAAGNASGEAVRREIHLLRERTSRPFGVNIMLLSRYAPEVAQVAAEERVPVVTTGAGNPEPYMALWKEAGVKVIPVVASVALARRMERCGADAVVAEGCEAGGHIGELTSMVLIPQVADAVDIPVIAAGGIGDGRGVAAALMLGAKGVQLGTRFLVAYECTIHENYKKRVLKAKDNDTMTTGKSLGNPVRALKNPFTRAFLKNEQDAGMSLEEKEAFGAGALRRAVKEGDEKNGCFMAGEIAGLVTREQSCKEIITELFTQADALLKEGAAWVK